MFIFGIFYFEMKIAQENKANILTIYQMSIHSIFWAFVWIRSGQGVYCNEVPSKIWIFLIFTQCFWSLGSKNTTIRHIISTIFNSIAIKASKLRQLGNSFGRHWLVGSSKKLCRIHENCIFRSSRNCVSLSLISLALSISTRKQNECEWEIEGIEVIVN